MMETVKRAIEAVTDTVIKLAPNERARLKTASRAEILTTLAATAADQESDPLAQARVRGLEVWAKLREAAGGFLSGSEVAATLGMTPAAIHKRYKAHQLLGIREEKRRIAYPALQFSRGRVVEGLPEVLRALAAHGVDEPSQLRFLAGTHARLGGRTALRALQEGGLEEVLVAARTFEEHGAA